MKKKLLLFCFFTINILIAQIPSYVPSNGLVSYWPFSGNANDASGNGNNGIVNGAILANDRNGIANSAYNFDGLTNHISISSLNNLQYKPISYSVWINPIVLNTVNYPLGGGLVLLGRDWAGNYNQGALYIYDHPSGGVNNSIGYYIGQSIGQANYTPLLNQWTFIVMTLDGNDTLKFYINGILVNSQNYPTNSTLNGPFKIGAGTDFAINSNRALFNGKLDDIGIWNRALTQAEITGLYTTLGTELTPANNQITVYPNPAKEQITIDCGTISNAIGWSYQIVNTLGQEVLNGEINSQQNVVSLNSLNGTGVYLVKIYDASNNLLNTQKIILQ